MITANVFMTEVDYKLKKRGCPAYTLTISYEFIAGIRSTGLFFD